MWRPPRLPPKGLLARRPARAARAGTQSSSSAAAPPSAAVDLAGVLHGDNYLGAAGPGLRSPLSMYAGDRYPVALLAAIQGTQALHLWPFAPAPASAQHRRAHRPRAAAPPKSLPFASLFIWAPCRLCGGDDAADEDIFHIALACPRAELVAARAALPGSLRSIVRGVWTSVERAHLRAGSVLQGPVGVEHAALAGFLAGAALAPAELGFVAYRLLMAAPWPAALARERGFHAAAALGVIFEAGRASHLRRLCTTLVDWANDRLMALAKAWRTAIAAPAAPAAQ